MEDTLLYSKCTDLNINFFFLKNTFAMTSRFVFDQLSGYHVLAKLTQNKPSQ